MHQAKSAGDTCYIVRSHDSHLMAELIRRMQADPSIRLLDVIGPPGAPHTAVVQMGAEMAAALEMQSRASHQFTIEPDRPLSLFGGA